MWRNLWKTENSVISSKNNTFVEDGLRRPEGEITKKQRQTGSRIVVFVGEFNATQICGKTLVFSVG